MADQALVSLLKTSRFNTAIRAGNNSELLRLGLETKAGSAKVWDDIPVVDFVDAYGTAPIPANVEARLQLLAGEGGTVSTSKPGIRAWFESGVSATVKTKLQDLAEREKTWFEDAGAGQFGIAGLDFSIHAPKIALTGRPVNWLQMHRHAKASSPRQDEDTTECRV